MKTTTLKAVLLDIDGTLLDSNDAHAKSWITVFERHGQAAYYPQVRRLIGMGGDKVIPTLLGLSEDAPLAKAILKERTEIFLEDHLPHLRPTPGARMLLDRMRSEGLQLVVATSSGEELPRLLEQAGIADLLPIRATSEDASRSKPDADIVQAALQKAGLRASQTVMLGDTPYDVTSAKAAGVDTIALRCGGWWSDDALGGAVALYDNPAILLRHWSDSPLARSLAG
ncbi:MAG: hydrolase, haloacid dehalogenase-like family [Rhizobacter sp.]|nr:hydrolase, haloacid dehalogenase-like family [Rhizobacter sp.]